MAREKRRRRCQSEGGETEEDRDRPHRLLALAGAYAVHTMMALNRAVARRSRSRGATTTGVDDRSGSRDADRAAGRADARRSRFRRHDGDARHRRLDAARRRGAGAGRHRAARVVLALREQGSVQRAAARARRAAARASGVRRPAAAARQHEQAAEDARRPRRPRRRRSAVISVNGTSESVSPGGNFPAANPSSSWSRSRRRRRRSRSQAAPTRAARRR